MIVDLKALQEVVDQTVVKPFDHTFLNKDIEYFAMVVPTAENIALRIQELLTKPIRQIGAKLHRVRLQESPNNGSEVWGEFPGERFEHHEQTLSLPMLQSELACAGSD
jgi:6-pyruvoyltetrahydropterin/6-carboxytetrahydropterin synthase